MLNMEPEHFDLIKDAIPYLVLAGVTGYLSQKIGYLRGHRAKEKELSYKYDAFDTKYQTYIHLIDKETNKPLQYSSIKVLNDLIDRYF